MTGVTRALVAIALSMPAILWAQAGTDHSRPADQAAHSSTVAVGVPLDSLAEQTARLTARFEDRRVAIADGYRRLGTDFPGMGEHWLHPWALLSGRIDPARPALLTYANLDGRPTLLGVGFVVTTRGDSVATSTPGWPDAWHEHSGLFADESGARPGNPNTAGTGTRVWVLHIWTRLANPGGRYAPDNWSLPFARVSLAAPGLVDAEVGRAFSLAVGGDEYLRVVLTDAGLRVEANAVTTDAAITAARGEVVRIATRVRAARQVRADDADALRATWRSLGEGLRAALGPGVEPFLGSPAPGALRLRGAKPIEP